MNTYNNLCDDFSDNDFSDNECCDIDNTMDELIDNDLKGRIDLYTKYAGACGNGNLNEIKHLYETNQILFDDHYYDFGFANACQNNHLDVVKYIVDHGDNNKHHIIDYGFITACQYGHLQMVQYFVEEKKANDDTKVDEACEVAYIGLEKACIKGHLHIVKYLNEYQAQRGIDLIRNPCHQFLLACACGGGHLEIVKYLIQNGMNFSTHENNNKFEHILGSRELLMACGKGHIDIVKYFIESKLVNVNTQDLSGNTGLYEACDMGHFDIVKYLVEKGADINRECFCSLTCLRAASIKGYTNIVQYLTEKGANLSTKHDSISGVKISPLYNACSNGKLDVVKYLIDSLGAKFDEDVIGPNDHTELYVACENNHYEVVKYLVEKGAKVNCINNSYLSIACQNGYIEIVKFLIEQGADMNALHYDKTCLFVACAGEYDRHEGNKRYMKTYAVRQLEVVKYLVECGADMETKCKFQGDKYWNYGTALNVSCKKNNVVLARYLIEQGANVNMYYEDSLSETCLLLACSYLNENLEMVKLLIRSGANVNHRNNTGSTCLHVAIQKGNLNVVKYLIDQGAILQQNNDGIGELYLACKFNNLEIVKYLIEERSIYVHTKNNRDDTIILCACAGGNIELVKYLIENGKDHSGLGPIGADIEIKNNAGYTPFIAACSMGNLEVVKYLGECCNANIYATNNDNKTGLMCAQKNAIQHDCCKEVVTYLINSQ